MINNRVLPRFTNTLSSVIIFGSFFFIAGIMWAGYLIRGSPLYTGVGVARPQPIPFSHERHIRSDAIDCRFCHSSVESSPFAGMPPTETCMQCHTQIGLNSPILDQVRESYKTNRPLQWQRIYNLPGYVHFDHSIHVNKGVGCVTCHGPMDNMVPLPEQFPIDNRTPVIWKAQPLTMQWCLKCHRNPENYVRPREQVFNLNWRPQKPQADLGRELIGKYKIKDAGYLTNCDVCHF
ncbi:MAG TPA: cytochrome c3 family protein [Blastocatellia bacterium]|nr:cytochrome c3 family protein [Blastocatellia bacterium]